MIGSEVRETRKVESDKKLDLLLPSEAFNIRKQSEKSEPCKSENKRKNKGNL